MRQYPLVRANFSRPADATAYSLADLIGNSLTAAQVVPIKFGLPKDLAAGRITGARAVVTPASGNLVITALDFDLLLFKPASGIPFADAGYPADNAALAVSAAAFRELVGLFTFAAGAWRNPAGGLTAGITGFQAVASSLAQGFSFNLSGYSVNQLYGLVQAKGAWTPGAVVNQFDFDLSVEI